jgi:hypothetical protein
VEPVEDWQVLRWDEDIDASRDAWLSANEAVAFEAEDHLMDRRWADAEMTLHVGFGWGLAEDVRVDVDEDQIVALFFGELVRAFPPPRRIASCAAWSSTTPPSTLPGSTWSRSKSASCAAGGGV